MHNADADTCWTRQPECSGSKFITCKPFDYEQCLGKKYTKQDINGDHHCIRTCEGKLSMIPFHVTTECGCLLSGAKTVGRKNGKGSKLPKDADAPALEVSTDPVKLAKDYAGTDGENSMKKFKEAYGLCSLVVQNA